jgi:hypothetical protein
LSLNPHMFREKHGIADVLSEERVDNVILDCIGYKIQDRQKIYSLLNIPILLPRSILAYAINQIF